MKKQILNLGKGLSKAEQRNVFGGRAQECTFNFINSEGNWQQVTSGGYSDGETGSTEANNDCVAMIGAGDASECHYDCAWDN